MDEGLSDFMWYKCTVKVGDFFLSDCDKTCDVVGDKMLGG